jgi:hypothetical protein
MSGPAVMHLAGSMLSEAKKVFAEENQVHSSGTGTPAGMSYTSMLSFCA